MIPGGRFGLCLGTVAVLGAAGCAGLAHVEHDPSLAPRIFTTTATLRDQSFELHLAVPAHPKAPDVLVLYGSGDGGWFGAAVDMFRVVGDAGFYAVGLSTRSLLHREMPSGQPWTVADLAADYQVILDRASTVLNLPPQRRIVLTGWSRGASLAVLVGGVKHAPPNLAGVIAIGLTADENLAVPSETDDEPATTPGIHDASNLDMYPLIAQVAPRKCAVIQASGDRYLGAARARELFGADTALRRFYEVAAKNHRFGGGAEKFVSALRGALEWITRDTNLD